MTFHAERVYRGVPADQRRAERRRRLMDAALEIMGTQGWSATTVRGVCQHAKLTARFFYESFEDLDTLAVAVFDEIVEVATTRTLDAVAAAPEGPEPKMHAAIQSFVVYLTDDPRRARIAVVDAFGSEPLMRRRLATMHAYAQLIAAQAHVTYQPPPEAKSFVDLTAAVIAGGMAELLLTWLEGSLPISREQLIDDCVALFVAIGESALVVAQRRAEAQS